MQEMRVACPSPEEKTVVMIMPLEYVTARELEGKTSGKVKILKLRESTEADVEFTCPDCGWSEKKKQPWSAPFVQGEGKTRTFHLQCSKCGFKVKLTKLKKESKKK